MICNTVGIIFLLGTSLAFVSASIELGCTAEYSNKNLTLKQNAERCNFTVCKRPYRIATWFNPPFTLPKGQESFFQGSMDTALKRCCGSCANFSYVHTVYDQGTLNSLAGLGAADILFPALGEVTESSLHGSHFIPLLFLPGGSMLYVQDKSGKAYANRLLKGVFEIWPLVTISLLLAFVAGAVIWLMDTWFNEEEFPRSFIHGSLEGFWWAFVSMTTVGYGDRSPKSIHGRIFAILWILIGITIFSLLTSSLTTAITSLVVQGPPSIYGLKVGVLSNRYYEINLGTRHNAKLSYYNDMKTMKKAFVNKEIEGILLDRYSMLYYWLTDFKDISGAEAVEIKDERKNDAYGILIPDKQSYEYFKEYFKRNKQFIDVWFSVIMNLFSGTIKKSSSEGENAFATNAGLFYPSLIACCVTFCLILIFGTVYEMLRRRKEKAKPITDDNEDDISKLMKKAHDGMMSEVQDLIQKWDTRLRDMSTETTINPRFQEDTVSKF